MSQLEGPKSQLESARAYLRVCIAIKVVPRATLRVPIAISRVTRANTRVTSQLESHNESI